MRAGERGVDVNILSRKVEQRELLASGDIFRHRHTQAIALFMQGQSFDGPCEVHSEAFVNIQQLSLPKLCHKRSPHKSLIHSRALILFYPYLLTSRGELDTLEVSRQ